MAERVLINLATGLEDGERVTVALLVAGAALERGRNVAMFLTKEAVRLAVPGHAEGVACDGCPPLARLFEQFAQGGGELLVCPICVSERKLDADAFVANARLAGATPMWEWLGTRQARGSATERPASTAAASHARRGPDGGMLLIRAKGK